MNSHDRTFERIAVAASFSNAAGRDYLTGIFLVARVRPVLPQAHGRNAGRLAAQGHASQVTPLSQNVKLLCAV